MFSGDYIHFNIDTTSVSITLASAISITSNITIDGYTQSGSFANNLTVNSAQFTPLLVGFAHFLHCSQNPSRFNAVVPVKLLTTSTIMFSVAAAGTIIKGIHFELALQEVAITTATGQGVTVQGCLFTGQGAAYINGSGCIGGDQPQDRNVFRGSTANMVISHGNMKIKNNLFGIQVRSTRLHAALLPVEVSLSTI